MIKKFGSHTTTSGVTSDVAWLDKKIAGVSGLEPEKAVLSARYAKIAGL